MNNNSTPVPKSITKFREAYAKLKEENEELRNVITAQESAMKRNREIVEKFYGNLLTKKVEIMQYVREGEDHWKSKVSKLEKELELEKSKHRLDRERHELKMLVRTKEIEKGCEEKIKLEEEKLRKEIEKLKECRREQERQNLEMDRLKDIIRNKNKIENVYPGKPQKKSRMCANRFPDLTYIFKTENVSNAKANTGSKKRKLFNDNLDEIVDL